MYLFFLCYILAVMKWLDKYLHTKTSLLDTNFVLPESPSKFSCKVGDQKAPFSIATTPRCKGGCNSFPWIAPL